MAGGLGRVPRRQLLPLRAGLEDPQHTVEDLAVAATRTASAIGSLGGLGDERFEDSPLGVGEFHGAAAAGSCRAELRFFG